MPSMADRRPARSMSLRVAAASRSPPAPLCTPRRGGCTPRRGGSTPRLPPISGPPLLGPEFDAYLRLHSSSASLGPRRSPFGSPQLARRQRFILGPRLQRRERPRSRSLAQEGCPVSCYMGTSSWNCGGRVQRSVASGDGFGASFGRSPTGRSENGSMGSSLSLPLIVPGF
mmetsp:Transcript_27682/g.84855  ORF Transcript_27682/g.84855 Transcript_27682/m.84855 type:complete len:171 (-) Transcript_27682:32-544(-)